MSAKIPVFLPPHPMSSFVRMWLTRLSLLGHPHLGALLNLGKHGLLFQWQNIQVFGSSFIYNLTLLFMGKITFKCLGSFRMNYQQTSKDNNIDAFNTHFCMNELFIV